MRRRDSAASRSKRIGHEHGKVSHILINYSGPSFSDLPKDILLNILLRLSIKRIFRCKGVCKTWNDLISKPEFAKLHFQQSQVYPMIRTSNVSRILHLVQLEKDDFELKLDMCDHDCFKSECVYHVDAEFDTKFELPLFNLHMTDGGKGSSHNIFDHDSGAERNKCTKMDVEDPKYRIVNSCNGLLCLSGPSATHPLLVCNPITGEFTKLPEAKKVEDLWLKNSHDFFHGFGFSPSTNQYKVIRMSDCCMQHGPFIGVGTVAAVHILGTEPWKDLGSFFMLNTFTKVPPIYLNGFLYWFSDLHPVAIVSFEIEKERFEPLAKPPVKNTSHDYNNVGMGVLGGELCTTAIEENSCPVAISVCVLKDCGDKREWSKLFSIKLHHNQVEFYGPYQPIKYLNDGSLLMFQPYRNRLLYMDPRKCAFKSLKIGRMESIWMKPKMEGIAHIPRFVSLKQALSLSGPNIKVLNVKPRDALLELHDESKAISLELEEEEEPESDCDLQGFDWDLQESDSEDRDLEFDSENRVLESNSKDRKMLAMKVTTMGLLVGGALLGLSLLYLRRKSSGR